MDESIRESFSSESTSNFFQEGDNTTPFDRFLKHPGVDMLQAALPYVSVGMRKPLALFMKFLEVHRIMNDLDRDDVLSACGFEPNTPNPEAMLRAMRMAGGRNANPQIDRILTMINRLHSYQSFMEMIQNNPEIISLLTNLMNQSQRSAKNPSSFQNQSNIQPQSASTSGDPRDILSRFAGKDTSDAASLLSQLAGKDTSDIASLFSQLAGKDTSDAVSLLSQLAGKDTSDIASLLSQLVGKGN